MSSVVGIPWGGTELQALVLAGRILHAYGATKETQKCDLPPSPDLRSCPDRYSSNTGFQEHSGAKLIEFCPRLSWIVCAGHLCEAHAELGNLAYVFLWRQGNQW